MQEKYIKTQPSQEMRRQQAMYSMIDERLYWKKIGKFQFGGNYHKH